MRLDWEQISEKDQSFISDDWTLYLRLDEHDPHLEIYFMTSLVKLVRWGSAVFQQQNAEQWCKKQAEIIFEQEKKKRK